MKSYSRLPLIGSTLNGRPWRTRACSHASAELASSGRYKCTSELFPEY